MIWTDPRNCTRETQLARDVEEKIQNLPCVSYPVSQAPEGWGNPTEIGSLKKLASIQVGGHTLKGFRGQYTWILQGQSPVYVSCLSGNILQTALQSFSTFILLQISKLEILSKCKKCLDQLHFFMLAECEGLILLPG